MPLVLCWSHIFLLSLLTSNFYENEKSKIIFMFKKMALYFCFNFFNHCHCFHVYLFSRRQSLAKISFIFENAISFSKIKLVGFCRTALPRRLFFETPSG